MLTLKLQGLRGGYRNWQWERVRGWQWEPGGLVGGGGGTDRVGEWWGWYSQWGWVTGVWYWQWGWGLILTLGVSKALVRGDEAHVEEDVVVDAGDAGGAAEDGLRQTDDDVRVDVRPLPSEVTARSDLNSDATAHHTATRDATSSLTTLCDFWRPPTANTD